MKSVHYVLIFMVSFAVGWGIAELEKKNSPVMYNQPSVCEVLGKNHPECK